MNVSEHPYGWLSLVPPLAAIVLAILTRRVIVSLLLGIFFGALILKNWEVPQAISHMCSDHLWQQLTDGDTLHVFFFTILMGTMVGMINRAAGMRGLVNALTPLASNRKRGQLTTWFLGLFVFFDDYANTMLLGNTLKPLTDRLRIAREKLAYLVDSTAAPVAGLALISTWVAGEIGYVQAGLDSLPVGDSWNAFSIFVQSIPYRFYVLFALLFVPVVALLGRDFGPMLKAEKNAIRQGIDTSTERKGAQGTEIHVDPTAADPETPARWFNAVIPIFVTVGAVIYFLYTSGAENTDSTKLMDIFGESSSYSSLLWGALWGAGTAYVLIAVQRLLTFGELHQAAADGARLMVPALMVLWLAQCMSGMTKNQAPDDSHRSVVSALMDAGVEDDEIVSRVANTMNSDDRHPAQLLDTCRLLIDRRYQIYRTQLDEELKSMRENLKVEQFSTLQKRMQLVEEAAFKKMTVDLQPLLSNIQTPAKFQAYLEFLIRGSEEEISLLKKRLVYSEAYSQETSFLLARWQTNLEQDGKSVPLLKGEMQGLEYQTFEYRFLFRQSKLYTGDFLSEKLASLREGDGLIADHFVALLPTLVFVLASLVAFSTGTSWGTMGIVMPLVIPLAYSQLTAGGETVLASDPVLLCCVGSVLAGAIFGDHCSPISDTTVLSSQASGCDHVAHVRTQLPYAILVGLVSILFGTLPIGYGVPVWVLLPCGIIAMIGSLWILGSKVEDPENSGPGTSDDR
ncbi:MAG: Na+/H+ antiporter NhaC family protein [Planctomycetota bacterium]|nr:Na+/H+ antiporter NhaC family protein [Planctomycetota bacterium]